MKDYHSIRKEYGERVAEAARAAYDETGWAIVPSAIINWAHAADSFLYPEPDDLTIGGHWTRIAETDHETLTAFFVTRIRAVKDDA